MPAMLPCRRYAIAMPLLRLFSALPWRASPDDACLAFDDDAREYASYSGSRAMRTVDMFRHALFAADTLLLFHISIFAAVLPPLMPPAAGRRCFAAFRLFAAAFSPR